MSKLYREAAHCAQLELWKGNRVSYVLGIRRLSFDS